MRGWIDTTLGDEFRIVMGQSPASEYYNNGGQGLPFFQGKKEFGELYPKIEVWTTQATKKADKGDVLLSVRAPIGDVNIAPQNCGIGRGLSAIKPNDKTCNKFILYLLKAKENELKKRGAGVTFSAITKPNLFSLPIQIPEDKEIRDKVVVTIETQFTRLDAATKSLKAIKSKLELYRKSVLKVAFDKDWQFDKLGNLFETTSGGTPSRSNKRYYTGMIPWLKSGELNDNKNIEDSEEHITREAMDNSSAKKFPASTVLIALYGATTGKLGILKKESTTNQAVCGIFPHKEYLPEFVFYFLLSRRAVLISQGKGGAQPNISQGIVRDTDFPRADKKTQREIIDFIESQLSVIDKIKIVIDASLARAERLRKSILKSAFEGKFI